MSHGPDLAARPCSRPRLPSVEPSVCSGRNLALVSRSRRCDPAFSCNQIHSSKPQSWGSQGLALSLREAWASVLCILFSTVSQFCRAWVVPRIWEARGPDEETQRHKERRTPWDHGQGVHHSSHKKRLQGVL